MLACKRIKPQRAMELNPTTVVSGKVQTYVQTADINARSFTSVQTYVAMVMLVAMHCSMHTCPVGIKVKFRTSIYVIHHARFLCAR